MVDQHLPMSPNFSRNVSTNVHIVSARISSNPYALLNFLCWKVKTREHSQFVGCLSFALFICLTVASFMIFEALSIFFIVIGIVVYAFLSESLFRQPKLCGIMFYIIFEALQVGFYIAIIIYLFANMIFYNHDNNVDNFSASATSVTSPSSPLPSISSSTLSSTTPSTLSSTNPSTLSSTIHLTTSELTTTPSSVSTPPVGFFNGRFEQSASTPQSSTDTTYSTLAYIFWIVMFLLLMLIKLYFLRVFSHYYKFVAYQERHSNELRAEYVNGRSVHLGFQPRQEYDNPIVNDPGYGYGIIYPTSTPLPELPTYHEAMSTRKPPIDPTTSSDPTPGQAFSSSNSEDSHRQDRI